MQRLLGVGVRRCVCMEVCIEGVARADKSDEASGHVRKQEAEKNKAGVQNNGGACRRNSGNQNSQSRASKDAALQGDPKGLRMNRNMNGNLAGDEVPRC